MAALGIGLGAFGAHGLTGFLAQRHGEDIELLNRRLENWDTAALYQMYHSIGLILVGIISQFRSSRWLTASGVLMLVGTLLFSGLLYALVLTETRILGAIVPIGGTAFIAAWICLAIGGCCLAPGKLIQIESKN